MFFYILYKINVSITENKDVLILPLRGKIDMFNSRVHLSKILPQSINKYILTICFGIPLVQGKFLINVTVFEKQEVIDFLS